MIITAVEGLLNFSHSVRPCRFELESQHILSPQLSVLSLHGDFQPSGKPSGKPSDLANRPIGSLTGQAKKTRPIPGGGRLLGDTQKATGCKGSALHVPSPYSLEGVDCNLAILGADLKQPSFCCLPDDSASGTWHSSSSSDLEFCLFFSATCSYTTRATAAPEQRYSPDRTQFEGMTAGTHVLTAMLKSSLAAFSLSNE